MRYYCERFALPVRRVRRVRLDRFFLRLELAAAAGCSPQIRSHIARCPSIMRCALSVSSLRPDVFTFCNCAARKARSLQGSITSPGTGSGGQATPSGQSQRFSQQDASRSPTVSHFLRCVRFFSNSFYSSGLYDISTYTNEICFVVRVAPGAVCNANPCCPGV